MKQVSLYIVCCLLALSGVAQNNEDTILNAVKANNKAIQANKKYWEARKAEFRTGLTPYDPQVEYDYLFGSPAGAGNQKDFSITQRFDFPSTYKRKKNLSSEQITQAEMQHQVFRQDILLQAKLVVLELIYLNKKQTVLDQRRARTAQLLQDYHKKLDKGEVIILDVNKAKLELLSIQHEVSLNQNAIQILKTKLAELNGGIEINIRDTVYSVLPFIPAFQTLDSTIEANDPVIKVYEQERIIFQRQIAVQKSLNLPKIEAGYHSQGILGQSYRGIHAGITIPLWENKNKTKAARANLDYSIENATAHRIEHRLENKQLYEQLKIRLSVLQEYQRLLGELKNTELLDKALRLGQITIIDYFKDQSYYYSSFDKYLQIEFEYHRAAAELYKYAL